MKVEFTPVTDYAAAVEALVNKKVDLAWFGGFTFVQAQHALGRQDRSRSRSARKTRKFRSVFITKTDSGIKTLADLKGKQVSFGSQSQHLGPPDAAQLPAAGRHRPGQGLQARRLLAARTTPPSPRWSAARCDAAALNITVWDKFVADKKVDTKEVDVFYTTPPIYDYNWTVHADMPAALREKLHKALLDAEPGHARGQGDPRAASAPRASSRPRPTTTRASRPRRRSAGLDLSTRQLRTRRMKLELSRRRRHATRRPAAGRGGGAAAAGPAGGRGRAAGRDRPVGRRQDHAAAGAGLRAAARERAALQLDGRDPWTLPRARAAAPARPAVPGAAGAAAAAAPARGHRGAGRPPAGDGPGGEPALAVLPAATSRRPHAALGTLRPGRQAVRPRRPPVRRRAPARRPGARAAGARRAVAGRRTAVGAGPDARAPGASPRWCRRRANAAPRWSPRCTRWTMALAQLSAHRRPARRRAGVRPAGRRGHARAAASSCTRSTSTSCAATRQRAAEPSRRAAPWRAAGGACICR